MNIQEIQNTFIDSVKKEYELDQQSEDLGNELLQKYNEKRNMNLDSVYKIYDTSFLAELNAIDKESYIAYKTALSMLKKMTLSQFESIYHKISIIDNLADNVWKDEALFLCKL